MLNDLHEAQLASEDFKAAIAREPGNGEAHLGLAYSDLDLGKPHGRARGSRPGREGDGRIERCPCDSRDRLMAGKTCWQKLLSSIDWL